MDKRPDGPLFRKWAVRLATYLHLLDVDEWEDIPPHFRSFFECLTYRDIVGPLVRADYRDFKAGTSKFKSAAQIAMKYAVSEYALHRMVKGFASDMDAALKIESK
jgi:hypothetical protein